VEILLHKGWAEKIASPIRWCSGGTQREKLLKNNIKLKYLIQLMMMMITPA